ncbi:15352_t:CDS:2 [Cetraspora pellucida]|uniref:15352_t:CDS:1 n=1 Tax=Cetraspora pellucida TaxID=1433469 RepID=A0ACA9L7E1_9GLOM|nr:15352_t:CDS:2 [Cetraspora pellucida]
MLLRLHGEMKSIIRSQSEEIKKIKDTLNNLHKIDEMSSRAQWPYWKYIINDIFLDFKYPDDETIKSVALCILSSKQLKHMRLLINNGECDSFFKSTICSITKDKLCKHRGTIIKKIKDKLFKCLRKLNSPISTMSSQTYMDSIISKVWAKDQPTEDDKVFVIAVCFYILDSKYEGMKLDPEKSNAERS